MGLIGGDIMAVDSLARALALSGAGGSGGGSEFEEIDPIYTNDKPNLVTKSELNTEIEKIISETGEKIYNATGSNSRYTITVDSKDELHDGAIFNVRFNEASSSSELSLTVVDKAGEIYPPFSRRVYEPKRQAVNPLIVAEGSILRLVYEQYDESFVLYNYPNYVSRATTALKSDTSTVSDYGTYGFSSNASATDKTDKYIGLGYVQMNYVRDYSYSGNLGINLIEIIRDDFKPIEKAERFNINLKYSLPRPLSTGNFVSIIPNISLEISGKMDDTKPDDIVAVIVTNTTTNKRIYLYAKINVADKIFQINAENKQNFSISATEARIDYGGYVYNGGLFDELPAPVQGTAIYGIRISDNNKVDKVSTTTELDQAYVKSKTGDQILMDVTELVPRGYSIARRTADGRVKGKTAASDDDLVPLKQMNTEIAKKQGAYKTVYRQTLMNDQDSLTYNLSDYGSTKFLRIMIRGKTHFGRPDDITITFNGEDSPVDSKSSLFDINGNPLGSSTADNKVIIPAALDVNVCTIIVDCTVFDSSVIGEIFVYKEGNEMYKYYFFVKDSSFFSEINNIVLESAFGTETDLTIAGNFEALQ